MSKEPKFKVEDNGDLIHLKNGEIAGNVKEGQFSHSSYGKSPGVKRWVNEFVREKGFTVVATPSILPPTAKKKAPIETQQSPIPVSPTMSAADVIAAAKKLGLEVSKPQKQDNPALPKARPKEYPMGENGNSEFPADNVPPAPPKSVELGDKTPEFIAWVKEWFPEEFIVRYDIRPPAKVVRMVDEKNETTGKIEKRPQEKTMPISGRGIPGYAKPNERR